MTPLALPLALPLAFDALLAASLLQGAASLWPTRRIGGLPLLCAVLACVAFAVGLVTRGVGSGQWPLGTRFEFTLWFALATVLVYLALVALNHPRSLGLVLLPLAAAVLGSALLLMSPAEKVVQPAAPVLRSIWLEVHVICAAIGYGAGAAAGALGIAVLIPGRHGVPEIGISRDDACAAMGVAVEMAFPFLSLALLAGAIWAAVAWGSYWSWWPKETWALVTWLVFLGFLHGRALPGWRGSRLAWLAVVGLGCILFTLFGVGWLARVTGVGDMHVF